jgi:hypothetical protein
MPAKVNGRRVLGAWVVLSLCVVGVIGFDVHLE